MHVTQEKGNPLKNELPYMNAYGYIPKVFDKMITAKTPPKFTQDFMKSVLGVTSSSARPIIPFMKRLGFLTSDGAPTSLYAQFRTKSSRGEAAAQALLTGFAPLFDSNEYIYKDDDDKLLDTVIQITGMESTSQSAKAIVASFKAVNEYADFDSAERDNLSKPESETYDTEHAETISQSAESNNEFASKLGLSYTINLNLPATSDIAVFNAIFKSLKENVLK